MCGRTVRGRSSGRSRPAVARAMLFLEETPRLLEELTQAMTGKEWLAARLAADALASLARDIGARRLEALGRQLRTAAEDANAELLGNLVPTAMREWENTAPIVRTALDRMAGVTTPAG